MSSAQDDLRTQARIRLAAVELFGSQGFGATTVRQIAERAGVSPPLVMHHFGNKNALRAACDQWVIDYLGEEKALFAVGGGLPAMSDYLAQHPEFGPIVDYLVAGLREGGEVADIIWQRLLQLTLEMADVAEAQGVMRLPADREAAAAYLVAASIGVMLMGRQFAQSLGGSSIDDPQVVARYGLVSTEIYTHGIFTDAYAEALRASLDPTATTTEQTVDHHE